MRRLLFYVAGGDTRLYGKADLADVQTTLILRGALQVAVAILAGASGAAAASFFIDGASAIALVGIAWGLFILLLDTCLVRALPKLEWSAAPSIIVRLAMSLLIAVLVSIPIEVVVFKGPIATGLAARDLRFAQKLNGELDSQFVQIQDLRKQITDRNAVVEQLREAVLARTNEVITEVEGRSRTGLVGHGPAWREKQAALDAARSELHARELAANEANAGLEERIKTLEAAKEARRAELVSIQQGANGLSDRVRTLYELESQDAGVGFFAWLIRLLLVFVELSPLSLKLTTRIRLQDRAVALADETSDSALSEQAMQIQKTARQRMVVVSEAKTAVLNHLVNAAIERAKKLALHEQGCEELAIALSEGAVSDARETLGRPVMAGGMAETKAKLDQLKQEHAKRVAHFDDAFDEFLRNLDKHSE